MKWLAVIEHSGKRVLTTQQLAKVYETEPKNIQMNYSNNKERFLEGRDYYLLAGEELRTFKSNTNNIGFAQNINKLYLWTNRGANRHCKILDTDKAWQQFDVLEETYFRVKESNVIPFEIPKTLPDALRLAADLADQKDAAIKQLEEAKPQILFSQAVATSSNSVLIGELAKILKQNGIEIGQNRLFEWLRQNEYLGKSGNNRNLPTQKAMKLGLFEIKKTSVSHSNGRIEIVRTPKVTGKGQIYIVEKFLSSKWKTLLSKKCLSNDL
jgi:phage antirepressor YoqD-like protein